MRSDILNSNFFIDVIGVTPNINVTAFDRAKISSQSGIDSCSVIFQSDIPLDAWEARATTEVQIPNIGVGYLVGSGSSVSGNSDVIFNIEDNELTQGDCAYLITIYGQIGGVWYG